MKTQKITILIFLVCLSSSFSFAQQPYPDIPVKEKFDDIYSAIYNNPNYQYPIDDAGNPANLGSYWAGVMDGLLEMYELTGDKAYLYKFIYPELK